jgi:hypothetical protein
MLLATTCLRDSGLDFKTEVSELISDKGSRSVAVKTQFRKLMDTPSQGYQLSNTFLNLLFKPVYLHKYSILNFVLPVKGLFTMTPPKSVETP